MKPETRTEITNLYWSWRNRPEFQKSNMTGLIFFNWLKSNHTQLVLFNNYRADPYQEINGLIETLERDEGALHDRFKLKNPGTTKEN